MITLSSYTDSSLAYVQRKWSQSKERTFWHLPHYNTKRDLGDNLSSAPPTLVVSGIVQGHADSNTILLPPNTTNMAKELILDLVFGSRLKDETRSQRTRT